MTAATERYPLLKQIFGHSEFRGGQQQIVDALLSGRDVMCIMPTGAGKSMCYQLPALMMEGVTLVISPLISLMKDQVMALCQMGISAAYINSSLTASQIIKATQRALLGQYKIVYVAPERLDTPDFLAFAMSGQISMVTVDEAHCVSQWGQDFRPSYLRIKEFLDRLPVRPILSAFTATATQRVRQDILTLLSLRDPCVLTSGFDRPNLCFLVQQPKNKFDALLDFLEGREMLSGIVYCTTRKLVEEVTERLIEQGYSAARYHAGLPDEERVRNQEAFAFDEVRIMVATNAFGMGIDKSNVSFVVHYNMPQDLESYYQEAGRAGRDGEKADCLMLYNKADVVLDRFLITQSRGNAELSDAENNMLMERNLERLRQMTFYATTTDRCLRRFILGYFGDDAPMRCGNCSVCLNMPYFVGKEVGKKKERRERQRRVGPPATLVAADAPLYDVLVALRGQMAREAKVPAYVIFTNATLRDMAQKKPRTAAAMLGVSGVGNRKLAQYGQLFMDAITDHERRNE